MLLSIREMAVDVLNFLVIFLMGTVAFTLIFLGLQHSGLYESPNAGLYNDDRSLYDVDGALLCAFWAAFGHFTIPASVNPGVNVFVSIVIIVYALFSNVLLINLLIAVMSETYSRVQNSSRYEYVYSRYRLVYLCAPPPPCCACLPSPTATLLRARYSSTPGIV